MKKYTYEDLIKEGAEQVKNVRWPGEDNVYRNFIGEERAFTVSEDYGDHGMLWIIVIRNGKETERINVRFLESIEWA